MKVPTITGGANAVLQGIVAVGAIAAVLADRASPELGLLVAMSAIGCSITSAKLPALERKVDEP